MMLQVEDLRISFGGLKAVDGVSFSVRQGSIHSLLGPNGAGKTTLFNLVTGALRPMSGTVRFGSRDVTGWSADRLVQAGVVRTFQRTSIFKKLSALENVSLAVRARLGLAARLRIPAPLRAEVRDEAMQCLADVGLARHAEAEAQHLAHGSQRALDVAIGLALKPTLIMMDEPLAGMSQGDRQGIADLVLRLREEKGLTLVIVEHDVGMVMRLSDRITVMQYGKVIADGEPAEIRDNEAVCNAYLKGSFAQ